MSELTPFFDAAVEFTTEQGFATGFVIAVAIAFVAAFRWSARLYESHRSAGRERMGLYVSAAIQSWLMLAMVTSPIWLVAVLMTGAPLAPYLYDAQLTTPIPPAMMVYWSAGLLLAMAGVAWIASAIQEALRIPPTRLRLLMQPVTAAETATWSLLVSPTAGFCEEIIFRSMLVPFAIGATGDVWLGVAAASLAFGVVHFPQGLTGILATAAMGAILAIGLILSGSIWPCIVAHALYNMAVPFLFRLDEASSDGLSHT